MPWSLTQPYRLWVGSLFGWQDRVGQQTKRGWGDPGPRSKGVGGWHPSTRHLTDSLVKDFTNGKHTPQTRRSETGVQQCHSTPVHTHMCTSQTHSCKLLNRNCCQPTQPQSEHLGSLDQPWKIDKAPSLNIHHKGLHIGCAFAFMQQEPAKGETRG
mmetsp:Transcript_46776/g.83869  ORF Transcript_46776/g.83869 Transcript_46776/m.83869 type:complete len:156 (+) Transcript_46776:211-678(+)